MSDTTRSCRKGFVMGQGRERVPSWGCGSRGGARTWWLVMSRWGYSVCSRDRADAQ